MRSPSLPPLDAQLLLEHAPWMRRLARSLTSPERAEDLSQETWRRLLESPPRLDQPFRGWIATVMRNLVRAERRGSVRRRAREEQGARAEAQPSSLELVERAALSRELVAAVLELDEPYRATVLLRYFEDLTPSQIAARERLPLATVKTRLARGLARLRERLARTHRPDGRTSVLAALAALEPVPAGPAWTAPLLALPVLMNAKLLAPLGLVAALALAYWLAAPPDDGRGGGDVPLAAARPAAELAPAVPVPPAPLEPARSAAAPVPAPVPALERTREAPPSTAARVRGRVIDAQGKSVAGVAIALEADGPAAAAVVARSAADGSFELGGTGGGRLVAADERWTTLLAGVPVDARAGQECRVVVAPRIALAGLVLDEEGAPVAGARLALAPPADLRARLAQVLDFSTDRACTATSDEHGRFRLDPAPALADARLTVEHEGYAAQEEAAPTRSHDDLVLVLLRPGAGDGLLAGTVVDAAGAPVAGALVALGLDGTTSDAEGRFQLRPDDPGSPNRQAERRGLPVRTDRLRALAPGHLPAELGAARDAQGRLVWPRPLVLVLGGEPLAIEGRVVDERDAGLAGMQVWIADATFFGGLTDPGAGLQLAHAESLLSGAGTGWSFVTSGADGRFRLEGLLERDYRLAAMDPATLLRTDLEAVAAGEHDARLVLSRARLLPRLAGRVVDGHGMPVAGVAVFPMCDAHVTQIEGSVVRTQHATVAGTRTDAEGLFVLENVPEEAVYLRLQGSDTIPLEWGRGLAGGLARLAGEKPEELVLTVERRCHFQVELAVPDEADEVGLLDAAGRALGLSEFRGNGRSEGERLRLVEGRSGMLAASDRAAFVVLYRTGFEVRRVPVRLTPGEPTQVRL